MRRHTLRGAVYGRELGDLLRAVAKGREANGDTEGAKRARVSARLAERRDGPGERYRRHVRTRAKGMRTDWRSLP